MSAKNKRNAKLHPNFILDFFNRVRTSQDTSLEKALAYILFCLSLGTPGIHLKHWLGGQNVHRKSTIVDIYVTCQLSFVALSAIFGWYRSKDGTPNVLLFAVVWIIAETVIYNLLQILFYNLVNPLNALKRNIILAFVNYLVIVFGFSIFYSALHLVRHSGQSGTPSDLNWIDYIYFSIGSGGVLGYGEYAIHSDTGKLLNILQCLIIIMLFSLFVTYNITLFMEARTKKTESGS